MSQGDPGWNNLFQFQQESAAASEVTAAEERARREAEEHQANSSELREMHMASGSTPGGSGEGLLMRLVSMLEEKDKRQDMLISTLVSRLDGLEQAHRSQRLVPPPPPPLPGGVIAPAGDGATGKSLDTKWIPTMPMPRMNEWKTRVEEIRGFWSWYEAFVNWLALIHASFPGEMKETMESMVAIGVGMLNPDQMARSQRLLYLLKNAFQSSTRVMNLTRNLELSGQELTGYEMLRQIRLEFSLKTRSEALSLRGDVLRATFKNDNLLDLLRQIESKLLEYKQLLGTFPNPGLVIDLAIPESDIYLMTLRSLPSDVRSFAQLHGGETLSELRSAVEKYHTRTRVLGDLPSANRVASAVDGGKGKGKGKHGEKGKGSDVKGKGKEKGVKGKGKGKNSRSPSREPVDKEKAKKQGLCFECGKPGHMASKCPEKKNRKHDSNKKGKHGKVSVLDGSETERSETEPASEPDEKIFMVLRDRLIDSDLVRTASAHESPAEDDLRAGPSGSNEHTCSIQAVVASAASSVPASDWLVDTGATSHILSRQHLECYRIVHHHTNLLCELKAANQQKIETFGVVDVEARFQVVANGKRNTKTFILQKCIVADVGFSVVSPFQLAGRGWIAQFGESGESFLLWKGLKIPMKVMDRAWWCVAKLDKGSPKNPKKNKGIGHAPMEVDVLTSRPPGLESEPQLDSPVQTSKSCLKSVASRVLEVHAEPTYVPPSCMSRGNLTFLCRGLEATVFDVHGDQTENSKQGTEFFGQGLDMDKRETEMDLKQACLENNLNSVLDSNLNPKPNLCFSKFSGSAESVLSVEAVNAEHSGAEQGPETEMDVEESAEVEIDNPDELELGPQSMFQHLAQGHTPFLSSCLACTRAASRKPARRLHSTRSRSQVGADFGFFSTGAKFLVVLALATGMLGTVWMSPDADVNTRSLNRVLREIGMTGRDVELVSDGEPAVTALFRNAAKMPETPVTSVHFRPVARSQANGSTEKAVSIVKQHVAAHVLFLESKYEKRIPLESPLMAYLLNFVTRTHNIYAIPQGSSSTALDKLRGKIGSVKPTTLPFGVTCLAAPMERVNPLEKFCKVTYLGPQHTSGGKFLGVLTQESRVGLEETDADKVRTFQSLKLVTPCEWSYEGVSPFLLDVPSDLPPVPGDASVVDPTQADDEKTPSGEPVSSRAQVPVAMPASGPPRTWIDEHGTTPDCYACKGIREKGTARGRVHSRACKNRYREWMEKQAREREMPDRDPSTTAAPEPKRPRVAIEPQSPNVHPDFPDGVFDDDVPEIGRPATRRLPRPATPGATEASGSGDAQMPDAAPVPTSAEPDVEMDDAPPVQEPMDIDAVIEHVFAEHENEFLRGAYVQKSSKKEWFESELLGKKVWQGISSEPVCEISGKALDRVGLKDAINKEFAQLTKLEVGYWLKDEQEEKSLCQKFGIQVVGTRWVLVQKPDRVRARLVCKEFRSQGLSSLREGLYAPTASLEALRLFLCIAQVHNLCMFGLDVSTAFLYAWLEADEHQIISLPPDMLDAYGRRLFLKLKKALYGLRRAPAAWARELRRALLQIGFEPTAEPTVYRWQSSKGLMLVITYVDDMLVAGDANNCKWLMKELHSRFEVKETGALLTGEVGKLVFSRKRNCSC